ncbi:DsbA family protein [Candidatus Micrarchaeota archaeon]|nr:DsbA family protein [Candidatus Micrarchaeota archaeon]
MDNPPKEASMLNQRTVIYVLAALLLISTAYIFAVNIAPKEDCTAPVVLNNTTINSDAKVTQLQGMIEKYFSLYGQDITFTSYKITEMGSYKVINFSSGLGQDFPVYVSNDLNYMYGNIMTLDEFQQNLVDIEAQLSNPTQPTEVPKSDKPVVELFVMSYCPYGVQAEEAIIPVQELLNDSVDFNIRFVSYAMHPSAGEVEENLRQHCIQEEQPDKFWDYLSCFVSSTDSASCLASSGIDTAMLDTCYNATDETYNITALLNDQSTWLSGYYPMFPIHADLNEQYGVQGSPTFVINGVQASVSRTPEGVKSAICAAFNNAPEECATVLDSTGAAASGSCS